MPYTQKCCPTCRFLSNVADPYFQECSNCGYTGEFEERSVHLRTLATGKMVARLTYLNSGEEELVDMTTFKMIGDPENVPVYRWIARGVLRKIKMLSTRVPDQARAR